MRSAPDKCPVCGATLIDHKPESVTDYAWWHYDCGGEVMRAENGKLYSDEECGHAMDLALKKLNDGPDLESVQL